MNRPFEIYEGKEVALRPTGNRRRGWNGEADFGVIEKIARKYFYVRVEDRGNLIVRFRLENFHCDDEQQVNGGYDIFSSYEDFALEMEREKMLLGISRLFSNRYYYQERISFEAVQSIFRILVDEGLIEEGVE